MSALQGAIAATELNQRAMTGFASMVTSTLDRATREREIQSNILEGMVQSAQNARQMEIDTYFKGQQLKLREKELSIDSQLKNIQLGMDNSRLSIAERELELQEDKFRLEEQKVAEADKYKPYIRSLSEKRALLGRDLESEEKNIKQQEAALTAEIYGREKSGVNAAIKGMTTFQRLQDEKNPNGKIAQLKKLQGERVKALDSKRLEFDNISSEIQNVTIGNDPGRFIPLPATLPNKNTSLSERDGNGVIDPTLFPRLPSYAKDEDKAAVRMLNEEIDSLEGQLPQDNYQNDLSPEQQQKIVDETDKEYIGYIFNPEVPVDEVREFQDALSPKGRINLEKMRGSYESGFLLDYGASKSYDYSKQYNPDSKASAQMSEMYSRSGGNPIELNLLKAEAETKLITLRSEANAKAAVNPDDTTFSVDTFVANGYNKWVSDRLIKKEEVAKADIGDGIKRGLTGFDPNKYIKGVPKSESEQIKELDAIFSELDMSVESRKNIDSVKNTADKVVDFTNKFISAENGFNRVAFYNSAIEDGKLNFALAPPDETEAYNSYYADDFGVTDKDVMKKKENERNKMILKKIKSLTPEQAFKLWSNR